MKDIHQEDEPALVPDNSSGTVFIRIAIPELKNQKCLQFQLEDTVWQAKQRILAAFSKDLRDALNYGLYLPPMNGRAGKFLEEERLLKEYPLQGPIGFLECKYKRRVYKTIQINPRKLKHLHSKSNLKHFLEYVRNGNVEKINKMSNKGLDPNFHDQDNGETPMTVAVTLGKDKCREVLLALVSGGSHIDFRNRSGLTAMHRAAIVGNAEAIKTMLDLGASPDYKDGRGLTPLYYSVSNDTNPICTEMLLHERATLGTHDDQGWCEIHQACRHGRVQHLEHLVFYGAELDVQNASGNTPLHVCAAHNQEACARVLLFRGADRSILNYSNQTAYQVAVIANNMELANLIKNHKDEDVVPIRELPTYSNRRKIGAMTPSMRSLTRSRSDPRLHASVLEHQMLLAASSQHNMTSLGDFYDLHSSSYASYPSSTHGYNSDSPCSLSISSASSGPLFTQQKCWSCTEPRCWPLLRDRSFICIRSHTPSDFSHITLARGELVKVLGVTDQGMLEGLTANGREGYFSPDHLGEVHLHKAVSLGDLLSGDTVTIHRNTLAALQTDRNSAPRVIFLHKSPEGYGFVLRGAKSQTHMGNLNFQPSPEFPALQYLDSVDPGSQADRAGLCTGDFILEINGENVVRASHERVVQLIRSTQDVLVLKVVTVRPVSEYQSAADWFKHQDGSMTLPVRKKQAPLPPRRDPHTSLSYSKATAKSMSEGLAEIEKLDQTIAEFDQNATTRRHSLHTLEGNVTGNEHQKVASVRAAHTMKRVSVLEMDAGTDGVGTPSVPIKPVTNDPRSGAISKMSPSELRIKKYHKKTPSTMERSKSTPDLADVEFVTPGNSTALEMEQDGGGQRFIAQDRLSSTWSKGRSNNVPGMVMLDKTITGKDWESSSNKLDGNQLMTNIGGIKWPVDNLDTPELPERAPMPKRKAPPPPSRGEVVLINTKPGTQTTVYANISEEIAARIGSPYESSFRPGTSAQLTDVPSVMTKSLEQAKLQHRKSASLGGIVTTSHENKQGVSFAEDRVYETAQNFIKKHPNAMLLVTADIHGKKSTDESGRPPTAKMFYEPEPDYDDESNDDIKVGINPAKSTSSTVNLISTSGNRDKMPVTSGQQLEDKASVTVLTINTNSSTRSTMSEKDINIMKNAASVKDKDSSHKTTQLNLGMQTEVTLPSLSSTSSLHHNSTKSNVNLLASSESQTSVSSSIVFVQHHSPNTDNVIHHTPPPQHPPPPPPSLPKSQVLFPATQSPPPPPPLPPSTSSKTSIPNDEQIVPSRPPPVSNLIPTSDILAAVAKRQLRIETEGLRVIDRPTSLPQTVTALERNQEALKAAIAKRKSKLENVSESTVVNEIELKLHKNRKLQSAKHLSANNTSNKPNIPDPIITDSLLKTKKEVDNGKVPVNTMTTALSQEADRRSTITKSSSSNNGEIKVESQTSAVKLVTPVITSLAASPPGSRVSSTKMPEDKSSSKIVSETDRDLIQPKIAQTPKVSTISVSDKNISPVPKKLSNTTPISKTATIKSNDFLALAEKARQEYLLKIGSSSAKFPEEVKPASNLETASDLVSMKTAPAKSSAVIHTEPSKSKSKNSPVPVSIKDKIAGFEKQQSSGDGGTLKTLELGGVTDDHSHTESLFSNGTVRSKQSNNIPSENDENILPPAGFGDRELAVQLNIIPPPPSFAAEVEDFGSGESAFGRDDSASLVSSLSSLSTLSSEHSESGGFVTKITHHIEDNIAPPPPGFGNETSDHFIPPPAQFVAEAGKSARVEHPFQGKPVDTWQCSDVLEWLDSLDMTQYKTGFAQNHIDGKRLQALERNDYIELGVVQVGHRMDLQRSIKRLILRSNPLS